MTTKQNEMIQKKLRLRNFGASCYVNVVIQMLTHIPNSGGANSPYLLFLYKLKHGKIKKDYKPTILKQFITKCGYRGMMGDPDEIFHLIYDYQIEEKKNLEMKSKFLIQNVRKITCTNCKQDKFVDEEIESYSLQIPYHVNNLNEFIEEFEKREHLEDYKCDYCEIKNKVYSSQAITRLSDYLYIHLKLFNNERKKMKSNFVIWNSFNTNGKTYILTFVICHIGSGSIDSGHYVGYGHLDDQNRHWVFYDDASPNQIVTGDQMVANFNHQTPYLLLYRLL